MLFETGISDAGTCFVSVTAVFVLPLATVLFLLSLGSVVAGDFCLSSPLGILLLLGISAADDCFVVVLLGNFAAGDCCASCKQPGCQTGKPGIQDLSQKPAKMSLLSCAAYCSTVDNPHIRL